jgi:hypothetical protein
LLAKRPQTQAFLMIGQKKVYEFYGYPVEKQAKAYNAIWI